MGRPSIYSQDIADEICERLANGEPLAKICRDDHMPCYSAVRRWEDDNAEFKALSTRAKRDGTHFLADDCQEIVDEPVDGDAEVARIQIAHRKLRVDTRLRLIGKWNSGDYGDKQQVEHTGGVTVQAARFDSDL
jgi:hypothetical protein